MRKFMKSISVAALATVMVIGSLTTSFGATPYKTYTIDGYNSLNETQTAYEPYQTITKIVYGEDVEDTEGTGGLSLKAPADMCIVDDKMYIVDSGNQRVIISTLDGTYIDELTYEGFVRPTGIFVTEEGRIYVCDPDAIKDEFNTIIEGRVFIFDKDLNFEKAISKPDHPLYGDAQKFLPTKIVVNNGGVMFIVGAQNRNGIIQMTEDEGGSFLGYFGTNATRVSFQDILARLLLTEEARAKMAANMPFTPDNLAIDAKNLIYTVTRGEKYDTLKKLNIAGTNMITADSYADIPTAVTTGQYNNIFIAAQQGFVYEFNQEGELLFVFGGSDDGEQRIGLSKTLSAIDVDNKTDRVYVLDTDANRIQVYSPTEFTSKLHEALYLYSQGRYTDSKVPLTEVLTMNSLFDYANKAMGKAYLMEKNYEKAMYYSELAKDKDTYSTAFWEVRNTWLQNNLVTTVIIIVALYILFKIYKHFSAKGKFNGLYKKFDKITQTKFVTRFRYGFTFIKHPIDGCYAVKREGKASYLVANVLLVLVAVFYIINKYFCGFLMKTVREGRFDVLTDFGVLAAIFLLFVACNYLVCTINDGESKFKELYCAFAYSFVPYLPLQAASFALSHVVTYNEKFLVELTQTIMFIWILVLLVISIKEVNNYSMKETFKVIFLTLFTALIVVLIGYILLVLWGQVFNFATEFIGEVVYRFG